MEINGLSQVNCSIAALLLVAGISIGTTRDTACGGTDERAFTGVTGLVADDGTGTCADQGSGCGTTVGVWTVVLAAGAEESGSDGEKGKGCLHGSDRLVW